MARTGDIQGHAFSPVGSHGNEVLGAGVFTATIPDDANTVLLQARAQNIHFTIDAATDPAAAVGFLLLTGDSPILLRLPYTGRELRFLRASSGAILEYQFGVI